jgi:hypothetical protein
MFLSVVGGPVTAKMGNVTLLSWTMLNSESIFRQFFEEGAGTGSSIGLLE